MRIEKRRLDTMNRAKWNPREMSEDARNALAASIERFGLVEPIILNERGNTVVGGHQRLSILLAQGVEEEDVVIVNLSPEDERALNITLNNPEAQGTFTADALAAILSELKERTPAVSGSLRLTSLLDRIKREKKPKKTRGKRDPDSEPEPPAVPVSKPGECYVLGRHLLLCGDATVRENAEVLTAGSVFAAIVTDPPYSSGGRQEGQSRHTTSIGTRREQAIAMDNLTVTGYKELMRAVLTLVNAECAYIFGDWRMWEHTKAVLESCGYPVRNMIVWDKDRMGMGFPWRNQHEIVAFAKRTAAKIMDGKKGNVLHCKRTKNELHETQKPVELIAEILENTEPGDIYDPFGGSGTTLIACESAGLVCRTADVDPKYADVIRKRWAEFVHGEGCSWIDLTPTLTSY